jgi:hypothetical protein
VGAGALLLLLLLLLARLQMRPAQRPRRHTCRRPPPLPPPPCARRYRTQLCRDGLGCKRRVCFFAHSLDDLRSPQSAPDAPPAMQQLGPPGAPDYASPELLGRMLGQQGGLALEQQVQLLLLQQQEQLAAQQQQLNLSAAMLHAQAMLQPQQQQQQQQQHGLASISEAQPAADHGWRQPDAGHAGLPPGYGADATAFGGFNRADFSQGPRGSGAYGGGYPRSSGGYGDYPRNSGAFSGFGSGGAAAGYSEAQSYGGFSRANFMASRQSLDVPRPVRPMGQALPPRRSLDFAMQRPSLDMAMQRPSLDLPLAHMPGGYPPSGSSQSSTFSMASSMASFNVGSSISISSSSTLAMRQGSGALEQGRYGSSGSSGVHMPQRHSQLSLATLEEEAAASLPAAPQPGGGAGAADPLASQLYTMSSLFMPSSVKPPQAPSPAPAPLVLASSPQPRDQSGAGGLLASPAAMAAGLQELPLDGLGQDLLLAQQQQLRRSSLLGPAPGHSPPAGLRQQPAAPGGGGGPGPEIPESVMQMLAAVQLYNQQARQAGGGGGGGGGGGFS